MKSFRVRWTEDGQEHESAVTYNAACAQERMDELEAVEGVTDIRSVPVDLGA